MLQWQMLLAVLLQSSQVQAPRARSGIRGLLQATGQRLVRRRATTMWAAQFAKCRLALAHTMRKKLSRRDGTCHTRLSEIIYPSPSLKLAGSRADTSGPSSLLNCAFQSDPRNNINRPATRRGRISVATAQMP